jgi:hypothetical protein
VIVTLWVQFRTAESAVSTEATSLAQVLKGSQAFPVETQERISQGVSDYVRGVVFDEWAIMRAGGLNPEASSAVSALEEVYGAVQGYQPATPSETRFYSNVLASLDKTIVNRRARLEASQQQLPAAVRIFLILGAFVVVAWTYFLNLSNRTVQLMFVGTSAVFMAVTLFAALTLDRPFVGVLRVDSQPYKEGHLAQFFDQPAAASGSQLSKP